MQWLLGKQVRSCADITCLRHETDELVEYLSRHMETLRRGQPAGMTTNLFSLETVGCVDSQPDCSDMVNREPPSPVDPMVRPTVTFPKWVQWGLKYDIKLGAYAVQILF